MKYEMDFRDEPLCCWNCGEWIEEAYLIEWKKGFEKEILCHECIEMLNENHKDFKIIATISELS